MNKTSEKKNVIISSTIKPGDLKDMDPKLSSFLEESEIFEMQIGEKSECVNLLHQTYDNGELTQEAIEMLTEHFKEDVGQLLGAAEQYLGILEKDIIDAKNIEEENNNNGNDIGSNIIEKAESQVEIVNQGQEVNLVENSSQEKQPTSMKEDSPENSKKYGVENEEVEEAILIEKIQQPKNNTTNIIASQFKKMLVDAKTENELSVVLKFAFEEKLGQLSNNGSDAKNRQKLEQALQLLDSGNVREAVQCAGG
ncbi:hypothetical protein H8E88_05500 [candidate division KSB1 bacterium]|nr:hypothetical protein [candidate division KSB1 bacterium]